MKKRTLYTVDTVFVLVLFAVFAITVLFVLMSGAGVYKNTQSLMQERYEERTALSYITAKVNHHDTDGTIYVTEFEGLDALAFKAEVGGVDSVTYMYYYGGAVRELTCPDGIELKPDAGQEIIEAADLDFETDGDLITVTCTGSKGTSASVLLHVASGLEAAQ